MNAIYHLSKWAQQNPRKSWVIIIISTLISVGLHHYSGVFLFAYDIIIPDPLAWSISIIAMLAIWYYPKNRKFAGKGSKGFQKRKSLDFLIFILGAILVVYLGNRRAAEIWNDPDLASSEMQILSQEVDLKDIHFVSSRVNESSTPSFSLSKKELKKQIKRQIRELRKLIKTEVKELKARRKKGERDVGVNILLTILTLALVFGLGILVAALACSVSCNGNETLGAIILIIG